MVPREGVPYPQRMLCSLKCELKSIWDALNGKLHSVNGVEGDGAGNVNIVSGDAAVVVTPDASLNQIEISLDQAQLPSAAVTSVNGETGAVVLDASEIGSIGGNVQGDINGLIADCFNNNAAISAEIAARGNADSALQTNINNVQAGIPGAAAAAVAADPTIAQLVTDMNDKVDVSDVSTGDTPDTIAKRNGSGRLIAADPASGATDKTLVTANWVSQTGSGAPNNLLHNTGNESKSGFLDMEDFIRSKHKVLNSYAVSVTLGRWVPIYSINRSGQTIPQASFFINNRLGGIAMMQVYLNGSTLKLSGFATGNSRTPENLFRASTEDDNTITIWAYFATNDGIRADCLSAYGSNSQMAGNNITPLTGTIGYAIDASGYTDENSVTHTFTRYAEMNQ